MGRYSVPREPLWFLALKMSSGMKYVPGCAGLHGITEDRGVKFKEACL